MKVCVIYCTCEFANLSLVIYTSDTVMVELFLVTYKRLMLTAMHSCAQKRILVEKINVFLSASENREKSCCYIFLCFMLI